jgi:addiction module RelE/StbE family toxin
LIPRAYHIEWRAQALEDLRAIVRYIGKDDWHRADSFGEEIRAKVGSLAEHPALGRPGRLARTRELVVHPNYIVYYRLLRKLRTVEILAVKHVAQQMP